MKNEAAIWNTKHRAQAPTLIQRMALPSEERTAISPASSGAVAAPIWSKKLNTALAVERTSGTVTSYTLATMLGAAKGMNRAVTPSSRPNCSWLATGVFRVNTRKIAPRATPMALTSRRPRVLRLNQASPSVPPMG